MDDTVIAYVGGGKHSVAVSDRLYVRGDDDGAWYECRLDLDTASGAYLWVTEPSNLPHGTVNISDRNIGSAFYMQDRAGNWHRFNLMATDTQGDIGYTWADMDQSTSAPHVNSRRPRFRAEDGIYMIDEGGAFIHKMGITGGLWSDLTQGYTVPL